MFLDFAVRRTDHWFVLNRKGNMSLRISVVIPTYKRPNLLMKCLSALANQDLGKENFEVLVVSDGPDAVNRTLIGDWNSKRSEEHTSELQSRDNHVCRL